MARDYKQRSCSGGCGKIEPRPEGWLCADCRKALMIGREIMAKTVEDKQPYAVDYPWLNIRRYNGQNVKLPATRYVDGNQERYDHVDRVLQLAIESLEEAATLRLGHSYPEYLMPPLGNRYPAIFNKEKTGSDWNMVVELRPRTVNILRVLGESLAPSLQACYDAGYQDGSNMLRSMAEGRLTIPELNRLNMGHVVPEEGGH